MDDFSFDLLKLYSSRNSLTLSQLQAVLDKSDMELSAPISYLRSNGYLKILPSFIKRADVEEQGYIAPDTPLMISFEGKIALEAELKERKRFKYNEFRAWVTLGIAIAALIVSIIALNA